MFTILELRDFVTISEGRRQKENHEVQDFAFENSSSLFYPFAI